MEDRYYVNLAAAFVQRKLGAMPQLSVDEIIQAGLKSGLGLDKFRGNADWPLVREVLGFLRGLGPGSLLGVGSGGGTLLWRMLDSFSYMQVTAIGFSGQRARDIDDVRRRGIENRTAVGGG